MRRRRRRLGESEPVLELAIALLLVATFVAWNLFVVELVAFLVGLARAP